MRKGIITVSSLVYLMVAIWLLFFSSVTNHSRHSASSKEINLTPFETTSHYFLNAINSQQASKTGVFFFNVGGNILLFIPLGIILFEFFSGKKSLRFSLMAGFLVSLTVETIQITTHVGNFDVDDIILNTTGTLIGFVVWRKWVRWKRSNCLSL